MSCYKASGKIYLRNKSLANQPFLHIGNASAVINTEVEETTVPDFTNVAGGNACVDKIINKVTLGLNIYDFKAANLAKAVQGANAVGDDSAITDELIRAFADELIPTAKLIDTTVNPVVTNQAGSTTYVKDTDYTVEDAGIRVIAGSSLATAVAAGNGTPKSILLKIDYTPKSHDVVEALIRAGDQYEVLMITQNRANSGKFGRWNLYAVDFGPTASLNVVQREFANFELLGEVVSDSTRGDGTTESSYFNIQQEV